MTERAGLASGDYLKVCWGTKFQDFDLDGYLDIFVAAGHVYPEIDRFAEDLGTTYAQRPSLWRNGGPPGAFASRGGAGCAGRLGAPGAARENTGISTPCERGCLAIRKRITT